MSDRLQLKTEKSWIEKIIQELETSGITYPHSRLEKVGVENPEDFVLKSFKNYREVCEFKDRNANNYYARNFGFSGKGEYAGTIILNFQRYYEQRDALEKMVLCVRIPSQNIFHNLLVYFDKERCYIGCLVDNTRIEEAIATSTTELELMRKVYCVEEGFMPGTTTTARRGTDIIINAIKTLYPFLN